MENEDELKEIYIKNHTFYYFDDIIRFWDRDIDFSDTLLDENLREERFENILIYDISYKTSLIAKLLRLRYDKIDGFIKIHGKIRYLVLFDYSYFDKICDKIKYLIIEESGITDSIHENFAKIRTDSYNSLPIEKILTFLNYEYLLSKWLIRTKISSIIIHFSKNVRNKRNPIQNIFK